MGSYFCKARPVKINPDIIKDNPQRPPNIRIPKIKHRSITHRIISTKNKKRHKKTHTR